MFTLNLTKGNIIRITFPYTPEAVETVKKLSSRTWNVELKCWEAPLNIVPEIPNVLGIQVPQNIKDLYEHIYVQKPVKFNPDLLRPEIKPYPFQIQGIEFIASHKNALLADDVGLGKTIQSIATALHLNCNKVLVICPASVKRQWAREIQKFTDKSCIVIEGTQKHREKQYKEDYTFYIINYELLLKDVPYINIRIWDMIIADEVSRVKNFKSLTKKSLLAIKSNFRLGLTATPVENRIQELHSIMSWINPEILGTYWNFMNEYCYYCTNPYGGYTLTGIKDANKLHETLKSVMIRRKKSDVFTDIPDVIHNNYYVPLSYDQKKIYKEVENKILNLIQRDDFGDSVLKQIMYLRELCNSPRLLNKDLKNNGKVDEIINIMEQITSKTVIFTQWKKFGDLLCEAIQDKGWQYVFVHGELSSEEKDILLQIFEKDQNIKILITTDCLSYGCNLQFADVLIHADLLWNPAKMQQRLGRVHRIGQINKVNEITVLTQDTIEDKVYRMLQAKTDIFNQVIEDENNIKFDKDLIKKIFKDK